MNQLSAHGLVVLVAFSCLCACSESSDRPSETSVSTPTGENAAHLDEQLPPVIFSHLVEEIRSIEPRLPSNVTTVEDFEVWRRQARESLAKILTLSDRYIEVDPDARFQGTLKSDGYWIEGVDYLVEDGLRIPAYVLVPDQPGTFPGVLLLHGHGTGSREAIIGYGDRSGREAYQFDIAPELARAGFVVFVPDLRSFGSTAGYDMNYHFRYVRHERLRGRVALGVFVEDARRALDVLSSHPRVDADRLAVAGISLGAQIAILLSIFDERPGGVVSQGVTSDWVEAQLSRFACECQSLPGIALELDTTEIPMLLAPTPLLVVQGRADTVFDPAQSEQIIQSVRQAYSLFGATDRVELQMHDGGHIWYAPPVAPWLTRWLFE